MVKIGNTSFREEAIKGMTLKEFKNTYKNVPLSADPEKIYEQITGKKAKEKPEKEEK
jgi:hypothetical protein